MMGRSNVFIVDFSTHVRHVNRHVNLMAIFFDVLVYDDTSLLNEPYTNRIRVLEHIIHRQPGRAMLPNRFHLNLQPLESAVNSLQIAMSRAIAAREEGLVIKRADAGYHAFQGWFKLKKDHIKGLGDTLDFVLVGAGFSEERALRTGRDHSSGKWNVWYVACYENKQEVESTVRTEYYSSNWRTQNLYSR
jgi:DNA ligase 4